METVITRSTTDRAVPVLTGPGLGSQWARWLLGVVVVVPPLLGGLFILGEGAGLFGVGVGVVVMVLINLSILGIVIWRSATDFSRIEEERRRAEERSRRVLEEAEEACRTKSQFFTNMSEELRTPLNSIIGFSEILGDETFGELNARQQKYVDKVAGNGRHLLGLVNNILDLSSIDAGAARLERVHLEVETLLGGAETTHSGLAGKKRIALSTTAAPGIPPLLVDPVRFQQILGNLLSNAIKFTPKGGTVAVRAAMWDSAERTADPGRVPSRIASSLGSGRHLLVSVVDSGIGIPICDQGRLFREFGCIDSKDTRQQEGTGLGLALTRRLVELHGGAIWVESEGVPGRGSTFHFVIPYGEDPVREGIPPNRRDLPLVLVIEGDGRAVELFGRHLSGAGYAVAHAFNGAQGIQMAIEYAPRAITLDILLPDQSGWDVLAKLKSDPRTRDIPVVVTSITEKREMGFSLGAVEYFVKPFDGEQLITTVGKVAVRQSKAFNTILVVDDEADVGEMLRSTIEEAGFQVIGASGGREAIQKARAHLPDLIALDLVMSEVNGFEVVRELRADPLTRDIPILVHTRNELTECGKRELEMRVQAVTQKGGIEHFMDELERLTHRPVIHRDKEFA